MKIPAAALVLTVLLATAAPSSAQARRWNHGYVGAGALAQPAAPALSDHFTFDANVETATADVGYPSKAGTGAGGEAAVRVWKRLGVGLAVSYVAGTGSASIAASIPHPFVFGQPRSISGDEGSVNRSETAGHVQLLYFVPTRGRLRVTASGGPTLVSLQQDIVTAVHYAEAYPYDTAHYTRATTTQAKGSALGFNAGADVQWMLTRRAGVGALVRVTRARVDITAAGGRTVAVDTGGVQVGGGLRLWF